MLNPGKAFCLKVLRGMEKTPERTEGKRREALAFRQAETMP